MADLVHGNAADHARITPGPQRSGFEEATPIPIALPI
jgi:hypothetical protein